MHPKGRQISYVNSTYVKEDISLERVKPRNSYIMQNIGFQATYDRETQENIEQIKEKNTQCPKKEISPVESPILLRGISLYG
jgi:hypothetical protein